ncbi:hypothetical protein Acid345_2012 [Candidatus Koribacter versatilis Ellin345]|uniref:DinB-like domain-containing protein n=1 Tax=Koribacter versatilis (strain Ellin345) TaxID=204669 RepID=Q1IQ37_KORVE|nr:DinB family protein [Candidatus Koribacter versatilis]ABF41013.1 hypothetical protein Acid345_2012 [Candidatus Koribacter versatilis Ellin345]
MALAAEIQDLFAQYDAAEVAARALVTEMNERVGTWRPSPDKWSVALCLDHIAATNRAYLEAMRAPLERSRVGGKLRRKPVLPGFFGRLFIKGVEPPVPKTLRIRAPKLIVPRPGVPLSEGIAQFLASQQEVCEVITKNADLDLASIHFRNPFIRGVSFTVASGLYIIVAHERRHLWQAGHIRDLAQQALSEPAA